jgi:hypothetical protein
MGGMKYGYDKEGKPFLTKEPKILLNDDDAGKPEGIHLMNRPTMVSGTPSTSVRGGGNVVERFP